MDKYGSGHDLFKWQDPSISRKLILVTQKFNTVYEIFKMDFYKRRM